MVNGKGPYLFLIDTGASGAGRIDASLVKELSLPVVGEVQGGDGSGRAAVSMPLIGVEKIDVGGVVMENLQLPSRDYNQRPGLPHVYGILGFGFFSQGIVTLDYVHRVLHIDRKGSLPAPDGKTVLSYEGDHIATFDLQVGDRIIKARLDSGNAAARFILPADVASALPNAGEPMPVGKARTVSGDIDIMLVQLTVPIRIGQFEFKDERVIYPGPGPFANVGSKLLSEFSITLDQANHRVKFERP
jgi:hypothetical protein